MGRLLKSHYHPLYTGNALIKERFKLRNKIDRALGIPFSILGVIWIHLIGFYMLMSQDISLEWASLIWILFQSELLVKVYLSPSATVYLRKNPMLAASAIIPVLRIFHLYNYVSSVRRTRKYGKAVFNS